MGITTDAEARPRGATLWRAAATVAATAGGAATVAFAVWWFGEVGGHCGVVRLYEQALGALLVGGWFVGTAGGLVLARVGRRPGTARVAAGSLLVILVSVAATGAYLALVQEVWEGDYTRKGTYELMSRLVGKDNDARILAARALGERGAVEALPHQPPGEPVERVHGSRRTGRSGDRCRSSPASIAPMSILVLSRESPLTQVETILNRSRRLGPCASAA